MSELSCYFLTVPILVLAMVSSIVPGNAAPAYVAGVTVGQWARYAPLNVTYHSTVIPEPEVIKDLNRTLLSTVTVQQVNSPNVTVTSISQFTNATTKAETLSGNIETGAGNLSYALIAGGLSLPDPIWTKPLAPSINRTISMDYLLTSRVVNVSNFTMQVPALLSVASRQEYAWDQTSGIVLEAKVVVFLSILGPISGIIAYTHVRIEDTNIFYHPNPTPSFILKGTSPGPVSAGNTATSTLTVTAVNGFIGTVTLTDTFPNGLACDTITPNTVAGSGKATLSCNSTLPATYTVSVTGASGTITSTTTITITVTAMPTETPNAPATILGLAPVVFYSIIGTAATIVAAVLLSMRTRSARMLETTPLAIHPVQ